MKHFIYDCETTNLIHNSLQPLEKQPHVIEIFGMTLDDEQDWAEVNRVHSFLDPGVPISKEVTKITGITQVMVDGEPTFANFYPQLEAAIAGADVAVAHNFSYDFAVVNFEYRRINRVLNWPSGRVCTVEATTHLKGFRLSLTALHTELFGEAFAKAHSAENDVRALARCYIELVKRQVI